MGEEHGEVYCGLVPSLARGSQGWKNYLGEKGCRVVQDNGFIKGHLE